MNLVRIKTIKKMLNKINNTQNIDTFDIYTLDLIEQALDNLDHSRPEVDRERVPKDDTECYFKLVKRIMDNSLDLYLKSDKDISLERIIDTVVYNHSDIVVMLREKSYREVLVKYSDSLYI